MIGVISKLWNFIANIIEGCDYRYSFILSDFSINVLDATQHDFFYQDSVCIVPLFSYSKNKNEHRSIQLVLLFFFF